MPDGERSNIFLASQNMSFVANIHNDDDDDKKKYDIKCFIKRNTNVDKNSTRSYGKNFQVY